MNGSETAVYNKKNGLIASVTLRCLRTVEYVIPAEAGIQFSAKREMDPGFRRGDIALCLRTSR